MGKETEKEERNLGLGSMEDGKRRERRGSCGEGTGKEKALWGEPFGEA